MKCEMCGRHFDHDLHNGTCNECIDETVTALIKTAIPTIAVVMASNYKSPRLSEISHDEMVLHVFDNNETIH